MSTTLDNLGRDHQHVLARLAAVELALGDEGGPPIAEFASFLEREVRHHFEVEEQALFPLLARHLGTEQGPLAVMNAEHATFRELLADLVDGVHGGDDARAEARARDIIALLRAHIDKEDHVLFPMASRLLSPQEQEEVDRQAAALAAPEQP